MPGSRRSAVLVLGVAAVGLLLAAPARAEERLDISVAPPPVLKPRVAPSRPAVEPLAEETAETPQPQRPAADAEEDAERDESGWAPQVSPTAADGMPGGLQQPLDGVIEVGEPLPVPDGIPDLRRDPRGPEDIAAFQRPPAGYDPYLFQIEVEPLADRRPGELFRLEPTAARGVRIGSFVLFPEAELGMTTTNNLFRNGERISDSALEVRSNVRAVSDWRAHALEFRAAGAASFYDEFSTEDDRTYTLEARGRLDISRRTNIEALVSHQIDRATRSSRDEPADAAARAEIETNRAAAAFNHRFNRLGLQLRGSITDVAFAPVPAVGGGIISNDERDFTQRDAAVRASWALNRKVDVFAETGIVAREFYAAPADGILRSSSGERYRAGVAFNAWDATIRGEISAGWGRQAPKDGRLDAIEGVIVDANLAWRASPLTTFRLTARSDFYDTTTTGSPGALSRLVGIEARHAFRRHLIGTAGLTYSVVPYAEVPLTERSLTAELGLDYYLHRDVILYGRYQHVAYESTAPASGYDVDILRVGVRVRQ